MSRPPIWKDRKVIVAVLSLLSAIGAYFGINF